MKSNRYRKPLIDKEQSMQESTDDLIEYNKGNHLQL